MSLGYLSLGVNKHAAVLTRGSGWRGGGFVEFFWWFQMIKGILCLIIEV